MPSRRKKSLQSHCSVDFDFLALMRFDMTFRMSRCVRTTQVSVNSQIRLIFTSWYDVSHAMGFRGWGRNSIKNHSLTHSLTLLDN